MSQDILTDPSMPPIVEEAPALQPVEPSPPRPQPKQGMKKKPKVPFRKKRN